MSLPIVFESNPSERYPQSGDFKTKEMSSDYLVILDVYVNEGEFFNVQLADSFEKYRLTRVNSDKAVDDWNSDPMKFYQNQINVVTWCGTTLVE